MEAKGICSDKQINMDRLIHGGDYNPEQWLDRPEVLKRDIELMKIANVNVVSVGIFSWSTLEPSDGIYNFGWLTEIVDRLYSNGIHVFMATPSGARPKWLSDKYTEVLRVNAKRERHLFGGRHNHCYTSPVYREKIGIINHKLGVLFGKHPGVLGWHISNELGGECHCPLCQDAFRDWLKDRYRTIENLNQKWYTTFWSHTYQSFEQIESPSPLGETELHALVLDWKRFVTHQTIDFFRHEKNILKSYNVDKPVTTNFMYYFDGLDYFKFKNEVDFVSWDTYPTWHKRDDHVIGTYNGMWHDMMRSIKNKPFILMESTPSYTNWQGVSKPKKPGMHLLSSLQAIAHGSDAVMYFQWRQSRGASEKFHGAVVQHDDRDDTRFFKEVCMLGEDLTKLWEIRGTTTKAKVAIVYDWENMWAMNEAQGPRNKGFSYKNGVQKSYTALKKYGVNVEFVDMEGSIDAYDILIVPKLYMFRNHFENKIRDFVEEGNTVIMTYWSGIVDENDQCYLGEVPYNLTDVFGVCREEFIGLYDDENNEVEDGYNCSDFCEVLRCNGATPLYHYQKDYYLGKPAVTRNEYGKGTAIYIGADMEQAFYHDFYKTILKEKKIEPLVGVELPKFIHVTSRSSDRAAYIFLQNFGQQTVCLNNLVGNLELLYGKDKNSIAPYETLIYIKK